MKGIGRGKSGKDGTGYGCGNFRGCGGFGTSSQPELQPGWITTTSLKIEPKNPSQQPRRITTTSLEIEQPGNPSQQPLPIEQVSSNPLQRTSPDTQSSRNLEASLRPSAVSGITKKTGSGRYKSKIVDIKIKCGGKTIITISDDIDRAMGSGARDIVNYSGLIMRTTVSFRDGNWEKIISKHGEGMWLKVKDKFDVCHGVPEHRMQAFVIDTMRRLFRGWKTRLRSHYSRYKTDEERMSHRPENVELDD